MRYFAYNLAFTIIVTMPVLWIARQGGLSWWSAGVLAIAALVALWKLLTIQIGVKKRSRYELEHFIQSLLVTKENGGWLDIKHRASPFTIRVIRVSGDDSSAEVVLAVPYARWSHPKRQDLARMFESQGISYSREPGLFTQRSSLVEARVEIPYIWDGTAGAKPARVAHLILDTFSVEPNELLDVRFEGTPSDRWKQHREELINL